MYYLTSSHQPKQTKTGLGYNIVIQNKSKEIVMQESLWFLILKDHTPLAYATHRQSSQSVCFIHDSLVRMVVVGKCIRGKKRKSGTAFS